MTDHDSDLARSRHQQRNEDFRADIGRKEDRKIKAEKEKCRSLWYGFGMFGIVGWSVAIPTLVGVAVGLWIDRTWQGPYLWTLTGLLVGVALGCLNAWYWVKREGRL